MKSHPFRNAFTALLLAGLMSAICASQADAALQCGLEDCVPVVDSGCGANQDEGSVYERATSDLDLTAVPAGPHARVLTGLLSLAGIDDRLVEIGFVCADLASKPVRHARTFDVIPIDALML